MTTQQTSPMEPDHSLHQRVVIFPAFTPPLKSGRQLHFLFSVSQVEDVIKEVHIRKVPFSPPWVDGIAQWREHVVPVISLEKCLGLKLAGHQDTQRLLAVKSYITDESEPMLHWGIVKTVASVHMMPPPAAIPTTRTNWLPKQDLVIGVYEWETSYLLVVDMKRILSGNIPPG